MKLSQIGLDTSRAEAKIEEIDEDGDTAQPNLVSAVETIALTDPPKKSFADMKQGRGKISFMSASTSARSRSNNADPKETSTPPVASGIEGGTSKDTRSPLIQLKTSARITKHASPPPADPTSISPTSGFELLRRISSLNPAETWAYLSHYPARIIPINLSTLLEPESLGQLLLALRHGIDSDVSRVRTIVVGLRQSARWDINVAMLDPEEETAGRDVWAKCAADGSFVDT